MVGMISQLSAAVAVPVLTGNVTAVHCMVTFAGQVNTGAVLSSTKIVWTHVEKLPQSSCDFQVRVIVNSCGHAPPVVTSVNVIEGELSQLSVEVGWPVAAGSVLVLH